MTKQNKTPEAAAEVEENELDDVAGGIWQGPDAAPQHPGEMHTAVMPPDFRTM